MKILKLTSLAVLVSLTTLILGQEEDCGGPLSSTPFDDLARSNDYFRRCTFPTYKLNVNCIRSSCPKLRGVYPLTPAKSVNQTGLTTAVSILNACLGQDGLICGINMTSSPMVPLGWTTNQILPLSVINGTCWLNPGTGYLTDLSSAQFSQSQDASANGLINLSIQTSKIVNKGSYNCTFNLPLTSFLQPVTSLIPSLISLNTQDMQCVLHFNVSITVSIDLSTQPPTINTLVDQSNYKVDFSNFVTHHGACLSSDIEQTFIDEINKSLKGSDIASSATNFLSTYAALSLQVAQQNCPQ